MATLAKVTDYNQYNRWQIMVATAKMRLINVLRYKGMLITDAIIPVVIAAMPILLGQATAGDQAGANFAANAGTENYVIYMLVGSITFTIVSNSLWLVGFWIRGEMERGTLEALYMTPTSRLWIQAGVSLYTTVRFTLTGIISFVGGALIFGVNPFDGNVMLALVFILAGIIPLFGLTMMFGAIIMRLKEANALVNLMQWGVSFLMGVFFPIAALPAGIQTFAKLFPPTWMTNGVRASLLGIGYFFETWYFDLAVLGVFVLIGPLLGQYIFTINENKIRANEGVGKF